VKRSDRGDIENWAAKLKVTEAWNAMKQRLAAT
jgi:hypothetical protein